MFRIFKEHKLLFSFILIVILAIGGIGLKKISAKEVKTIYNKEDIKNLDKNEIADGIANMGLINLNSMIENEELTLSIYNDEEKMQCILKGLKSRGKRYTNNNDMGVANLIRFINGLYELDELEDYDFDCLKDDDFQDSYIDALVIVGNNKDFSTGILYQDEIVSAVKDSLEYVESPEIVNSFIRIVEDFNENTIEYIRGEEKKNIFLNIMSDIKISITDEDHESSIYEDVDIKKIESSIYLKK